MTDYVALLKENDLKATFQRINILDVIDKKELWLPILQKHVEEE